MGNVDLPTCTSDSIPGRLDKAKAGNLLSKPFRISNVVH
jgi:hypothetical protein